MPRPTGADVPLAQAGAGREHLFSRPLCRVLQVSAAASALRLGKPVGRWLSGVMLRSKRPQILIGMALGALWGVVVTGLPQWLGLPYIPAPIALPGAFLAPGLVLALIIGRLAQRRFFDDAIIDGEPFAPGTAAEIDQRVLANTVEQLVLALAIWPFAAVTLGGAVAITLGLSFALMRVLFWAGYHLSPPLRGLGFAGTFYPTVIAGIWAAAVWV